jgi:ABC-type transport system involved in cytochrome bd biosynthesis fused ATPase/permease subunit
MAKAKKQALFTPEVTKHLCTGIAIAAALLLALAVLATPELNGGRGELLILILTLILALLGRSKLRNGSSQTGDDPSDEALRQMIEDVLLVWLERTRQQEKQDGIRSDDESVREETDVPAR